MTSSERVPAWPRYRLTAGADETVTVTGPAAPSVPYPSRTEAIAAVAAIASRLVPPRAVFADAADTDGTVWPLLIEPSGDVREVGAAQRTKQPRRRTGKEEKFGGTDTVQATVTRKPRRTMRRNKARQQPTASAGPVPQQKAVPLPQGAVPFVVPTVAEDKPTARVRVQRARHEEPTVRVRASQTPPVVEQHERPAEASSGLPPVAPQPAPTPAPVPGADPRFVMQTAPQERPQIPSVRRIHDLEQAGRIAEAAQMAAALDDAAAGAYGPSHSEALNVREVRAHLTAQLGDLPGAVALYRDVAERWAFQNDAEAADAAAGRAHALWLRITDPAQAIATGEIVVRMRNGIPGEGGIAYRKAVKYLDRLREQAAQPGAPR